MKTRFVAAVMLLFVAVSLSSCRKNPKQPLTGPAMQTSPASGQNKQGQSAGQSGQPLQTTPQADKIENSDNPSVPPGNGTIKGSIYIHGRQGHSGNMFVYIIDDSTLNNPEPGALSSQVILADQITSDTVDFTLNRVPSGERRITVVWDVFPPNCSVSQSACPLSVKDMAGQSGTILVMPDQTVDNVEIDINPLP